MQSPVERQNYPDDEIDLFELFENIWSQKWFIASITAFALTIGAIVALGTTPVYRASAQIQLPLTHTVAPLNSLYGLGNLTPESLTENYLQTLSSNEFKTLFLEIIDDEFRSLISKKSTDDATLFKALSEAIEISVPNREKASATDFATVSFSAKSFQMVGANLTLYVDKADSVLADKIRQNFNISREEELNRLLIQIQALEKAEAQKRLSTIQRLQEKHTIEMAQLQDQLDSRKHAYDMRLKDRIISLEEALAVARTLKIDEPVTLSQLSGLNKGRVEISADIRNQADPLYLRGIRLLSAELKELKNRPENYYPDSQVRELEAKLLEIANNREIEVLSARSSDGDFSDRIVELQGRLIELGSQQFPDHLKFDFVRGAVITDPSPVKPKKALIIALSLVIGGMVGVLAALIRSAIRKRKALMSTQ